MNNSAITIKKCVEEFASYESLKRKKQKEKVFTKGVLYDFSDQVTAEWYIADLFDITNLITCGVAKRPDYVDEGIPFLSAQNARPFKTNLNKIRYIDEDTFNKITVGGKPEKGDILYTRVGNCGEAATIPYDFDFGVYVSLTLIKPNKLFLDSDYLTAFLNSRFGVMQASQGAIGIGLKNLNVDNVRRYKIPLPPISEQKRIVEKLDSLLAQVGTIQQRLNNLPKIIKRFRQSVLAAAVSGKLTEQWRKNNQCQKSTIEIKSEIKNYRYEIWIQEQEAKFQAKGKVPKNDKWKEKYKEVTTELNGNEKTLPKGWVYETLEGLIYISARIGWKGLKAEEYTEEGPLFLSVHGLNHGQHVDLSRAYHISEERYKESPEIQLKNEDILLCKDGAGIGKIAIIKDLTELASINSSLLLIRSGKYFLTDYLYYFLAGPEVQRIVQERMTGSAVPHLFQRDVKGFVLEVPPIEEQTEIVRLVEQHFALADTLEKNLKNAKQKVDNLTQSILAKAFRGELVPQDPNDEPAEQLLARIKTARAEAELLEKAAKKAAKKTKG